MLMQNLGGQTKSIKVFSEMAYWVSDLKLSKYAQQGWLEVMSRIIPELYNAKSYNSQ